MKASIKIDSAKTEVAELNGFEVHFEYTVEEFLALVEKYPEVVAKIYELMKS